MLIGLHHVGRIVTNLGRAASDLGAITGWPVTIRLADDGFVAGRADGATAWAEGPNGWIELVEVAGASGTRREVNEPGVTHAGIQTGDIGRVVERLTQAGIDRHADPVALGTGFSYMYVRDAEQLVTEVEGAPHAPADLDAWLAHGAIATPDIDRLRAAYEHLVEATAVQTARLGGRPVVDRLSALDDVDVTGTWVPLANAKVEIWQFHHPATSVGEMPLYEAPGSGHLAFETDDLPNDLARAIAAGFRVEDEPIAVHGLEIARLRDPDGNWIELVALQSTHDPRSLRQRPDLRRPARMDALRGDAE